MKRKRLVLIYRLEEIIAFQIIINDSFMFSLYQILNFRKSPGHRWVKKK